MIVFIDGYNVIKFLLPRNRDEHDAQRAWLIAQMSAYRHAKRDDLKDVVVVFDGGMFGHRQREITSGVAVVFSGRGRCADSVLIEYAHKYGNQAVAEPMKVKGTSTSMPAVFYASVIAVDPFYRY